MYWNWGLKSKKFKQEYVTWKKQEEDKKKSRRKT